MAMLDLKKIKNALREALYDRFDEFLDEEIIDGCIASAAIKVADDYYAITVTDASDNMLREGASEREIVGVINSLVDEALTRVEIFHAEDAWEASRMYYKKWRK